MAILAARNKGNKYLRLQRIILQRTINLIINYTICHL